MNFHILTLFTEMFRSPLSDGIVGRAQRNGLVNINLYDIRKYTHDRHRKVDDYQFGGGAGMLFKPEPMFEGIESIRLSANLEDSVPIILLSPQGRRLNQRIVEEISTQKEVVLICGRYEGVDERIRKYLVTDEISIGDYVLSGGELASMVLIDAVSRLISGVVGSIESTQDDSFTTGLLQHPQYTRPSKFRGWEVPEILVSGNHAQIEIWRRQESLRRTFILRPELLESADLTNEDILFIDSLQKKK
tara:strand:+ start:39 stop:779 length:741 start_codon:yes stop_codon:yes gene_type:complete